MGMGEGNKAALILGGNWIGLGQVRQSRPDSIGFRMRADGETTFCGRLRKVTALQRKCERPSAMNRWGVLLSRSMVEH